MQGNNQSTHSAISETLTEELIGTVSDMSMTALDEMEDGLTELVHEVLIDAPAEMKNSTKLIPDLLYPIPVVGSIRMGEIVTLEGGGRLPRKTPYFVIASQTKQKHPDGGYFNNWLPHPLHKELIKQSELTHKIEGENQLKDIPVRLMFNDPGLIMTERYEVVSKTTGQIACASIGNGQARTYGAEGLKTVSCPGPAACEFGRANKCKLKGRVHLQIEGQDDPLSAFLLRTSGYNSVRTMRAKLKNLFDLSGGRLAHMPLLLRLRVKLTPKGEIFYGDLVFRTGQTMTEAIKEAKLLQGEEQDNGLSRAAYEEGMRKMMANGAFQDSEEDAVEVEDWEGSFTESNPTQPPMEGNPAPAVSVTSGEVTVSASPAAQNTPIGLNGLKAWLDGNINETGESQCVTA